MAYKHNPKLLTEIHRRIYDSVCNGSNMTVYKIHQETGISPSTVASYIHFLMLKGVVEAISINGKSRNYYTPTEMTYEELEQSMHDEQESLKAPDPLLEKIKKFTLTKQEYEFYRANLSRMGRTKIAKELRLSKIDFNAGIENYEKSKGLK